MSAPIITPALVRRYLIATGPTLEELQVFDALVTGEEALDGFLQDFEIDCPALGMLAAAEIVRQEAQGYEVKSTDEDGPREAMLDVVSKLIKAAGVDPKVWEKARNT